MMDSFEKIKNVINKCQSFVILPHVNADGDATGSSFALAAFLRKLGKTATVVFEEFPRLSEVVAGEYIIYGGEVLEFDASFAVDCGDIERLASRASLFCKKTVCIYHHITDGSFGDVNHTEPESSATGEIIYELIKYIDGSLFDTYISECLHMAISADSGCFKYSNTSARTHRIAAELIEIGGDFTRINRELFDTVSLKKLKIQGEAINQLQLSEDGRVAMYYLSLNRFNELQLSLGDVDFISNVLKNIEGVSVGAFIREKEPGVCKVSLRTDDAADASVIAKKFGGGGHMRAAGFQLDGDETFVTGTVRNAIFGEIK